MTIRDPEKWLDIRFLSCVEVFPAKTGSLVGHICVCQCMYVCMYASVCLSVCLSVYLSIILSFIFSVHILLYCIF